MAPPSPPMAPSMEPLESLERQRLGRGAIHRVILEAREFLEEEDLPPLPPTRELSTAQSEEDSRGPRVSLRHRERERSETSREVPAPQSEEDREEESLTSRAFLVLLPDRSVRLYACASLTADQVLSDFPNHTLSLLPSRHVSMSLLPDVTLLSSNTYYLHQQPGALAASSSALPRSFPAASSRSADVSPCHVAAPDAATSSHRPLRKHGVSCQFPPSASFEEAEPSFESLLQKRSTFPGPMPLNPQYYSQPFPAPPNRQRTSQRASRELPQALLYADVSKSGSGAVTPPTRLQGLPPSRSFDVQGRGHERTPSVPEEAFGGGAQRGASPAFFLPSLSPSSSGVESPAAAWFKTASSSGVESPAGAWCRPASSCSVSPFHSQAFGRLPPLPRGTLTDDQVATMHLANNYRATACAGGGGGGGGGAAACKREHSDPFEEDTFDELQAFLLGGKGKPRRERKDETLDELNAFLQGGKQRRERASSAQVPAGEHAPPLHRTTSALAFNDRRGSYRTVHEASTVREKPQQRTALKNSILAELEELEAQEAAEQGPDPAMVAAPAPPCRGQAAAAAAAIPQAQAEGAATEMKKAEGQPHIEAASKGHGSILSKLSSRFGAAKRMGMAHNGSSTRASGGGGHNEWNAAPLHYSLAVMKSEFTMQ